jgi:protein NrfC
MHADPDNGGVRRVDEEKCIGCGSCVRACPHAPSRAVLLPDERSGKKTIRKCDLCADAPFLCDEDGNPVKGGPGGVQACVQVCPVRALRFTTEMPDQGDADGYRTNLRGEEWENLGYPVDE